MDIFSKSHHNSNTGLLDRHANTLAMTNRHCECIHEAIQYQTFRMDRHVGIPPRDDGGRTFSRDDRKKILSCDDDDLRSGGSRLVA